MIENPPATTTEAGEFLSERDVELFRLVAVEGRSYEVVAKDHDVCAKHVRRVVRKTERVLALRSLHQEAGTVRAMHLHRLEHQWQEAMLAWYRSQRDATTLKLAKKTPTAEPSIERVAVKQFGDVRYLDYARRLLGEIRQLGGVADLSSGGETNATVEALTIEQRTVEFHQLIATLRERARADADDRADLGPVADAAAADAASGAATVALAPPAHGQAADVARA